MRVLSCRDGFFGCVEQMHIAGCEMQPDGIAHARVGMTNDANREQADIGHVDIGKAVGAEMFHDIDLAGQDGF